MNRKNLTAAVLAGLAGAAGIVGSAQAVNINPDGLGQVLIYPYYTTNGGNQTVLSVVNTSENAKAVKVRFLEGQNSQEVLDFNLYMSKYDVWAAAIADVNGTPTLVVNDTTCTVPYLYENTDANGVRNGQQPFLPWEMMKDGGSSNISRAAEGHFEMIEMGTLVDAIEDSATAATHVPPPKGAAPGTPWAPYDCGQLTDAWTDNSNASLKGYWMTDNLIDLEAPSGGLFGGAAIVNVANGTMYSYDAKAINGFSSTVQVEDKVSLHQVPGSVLPSLNSGDNYEATVFKDDGTTLVFDAYTSLQFPRSVDAISFLFMHDQIMNEYTTEANIGAATEWVISFPTKNFYVYKGTSGSDKALKPFTSAWNGEGACEVVQLDTIWDREERQPVTGSSSGPIVSPAPPGPLGIIPFSLCFETSVIRFEGDLTSERPLTPPMATEILGSTNFHTIDNGSLGFEAGWVRLQLAHYPETDADGRIKTGGKTYTRHLDELTGLPITGFAVQRFENAFLDGGVLANYGGIYSHKGTRRVSQTGDVFPGVPATPAEPTRN